ncbi:FMN-binding glutamate synthase family protein [Heliorestis acidaminivorans]|uniref:FMN-binding glutamate synthase family protein n=1 Tax=Heliorestis acidaminivorans TaxID=553427 RepID=A0A6I0EY43_9FIRM|nr:FMN-binding glutamate synthase family protein [Heliorestis acidaminivorans]KAB2951576.1 FMN-binding glutamate synthase family protein [Heliorestis acidaminivorans]
MTYSKLNRSAATLTKCRTPDSIVPFSGLCATCLDGCPGFCEVGKAAYRSKETLYPQPFGTTTSASEKDYPVDYSHFNIMGTAVGAHGIEADSDKAIFPAANIETEIGNEHKIKLKNPIIVAGMGSTNVAANNWDHLASGCAISGAAIVIGENICGMDPNVEIKNGRVVHSPALEKRVRDFQDWYQGYGCIAVQANVEDTRLGVQEYAIEKLGVTAVELKWGQGAKDIGGEVKLNSLERALELHSRGYIVLPDPTDAGVQRAYKSGSFKEFERHSRVGMVTRESFMARVEELRQAGAKNIFLKTGAYRAVDLARAVKFASDAKLDLLTVDGAGGGTGMSPWRMMNEWGVPTIYIQSLLIKYLDQLKEKGAYIPPVAIAGGITLEDQMFKAFAMGSPYIKVIAMARSPLTAAMVGKTIGNQIKEGKVSGDAAKYGTNVEQIFAQACNVKNMLGDRYSDLPVGAIGVYSYFERLGMGLKQFMCGARKFSLDYITRDDVVALTKEAAEISGIRYIMEHDEEEAQAILNS